MQQNMADLERVAQDPTGQGMKARVQHKRRDACPYSLRSEERHEWLEGYDGMSIEGGPLVQESRCASRSP